MAVGEKASGLYPVDGNLNAVLAERCAEITESIDKVVKFAESIAGMPVRVEAWQGYVNPQVRDALLINVSAEVASSLLQGLSSPVADYMVRLWDSGLFNFVSNMKVGAPYYVVKGVTELPGNVRLSLEMRIPRS